MKIVYITPHLSTGGMPEYLRKKVELLHKDNQVWVLEMSHEPRHTIIRDKIESLIGENLVKLDQNYNKLLGWIEKISPDVLHFEEPPDYFIPEKVLDIIYAPSRTWKIFETLHDSSIDWREKRFIPDKMLVVSLWQSKNFLPLGVPVEIIEYEVSTGNRNRERGLQLLGLDPEKKHVLQVGIFSRRKNQKWTFELAKHLPEVQFHFVGGTSENYRDYWQELLDNKPENCVVWGERSDVQLFYSCVDAVVFPSEGSYGDTETNPLAIKEAIAWKIPLFLRNIGVYMNMYPQNEGLKFITNNLETDKKILQTMIGIDPQFTVIKQDFFKQKLFDIKFDPSDNKVSIFYLKDEPFDMIVCIRDIDSQIPIYSFSATFANKNDYWAMPLPKNYYDFIREQNFRGFLVDFYDPGRNLLYSQELPIKDVKPFKKKFRIDTFEPVFINYEQFFTDRIYDRFLNNLGELDLVLDVGSSCGLFTQLIKERGFGKLYAFEVSPKATEVFNQIHGRDERIELINKAVWSGEGKIKIYEDPENSIVSSAVMATSNYFEIESISLDSFFRDNNIQKVGLMKMDIEAGEYKAFEGLSDVSLSKIENLILEFHENFGGVLWDKILRRLDNLGYNFQIFREDCKNPANLQKDDKGVVFASLGGEIKTENSEEFKRYPIDDDFISVILDRLSEIRVFDYLIPRKTKFNKVRLGPKNDGGYTIADGLEYDALISGGVGDNIDFEKEFLERYRVSHSYIFDGTVDGLPTKDLSLQFFKKNISGVISEESENLHQLLKQHRNIFLKLDIEAWEYNWLESLPEDILKSVSQLVIEIHYQYSEYFFYDGSPVPNPERKIELFKSILKTHKLIHLSPNNCCGVNSFSGVEIPNVFECTFIRKDLCNLEDYNTEITQGENNPGNPLIFNPLSIMDKKSESPQEVTITKDEQHQKTIIIIDSYVSSERIQQKLIDQINRFKLAGFDVMLVSNTKIDIDIQDLVDYFFYDRRNQLFEHDYKDVSDIFHEKLIYSNLEHQFTLRERIKGYQRHGLSVLINIANSVNLAKSLGYKNFIRCEVDDIFGERSIDWIKEAQNLIQKEKKKALLFFNDYDNQPSNLSLHFMFWNIDFFIETIPKIENEEDYRSKIKELGEERDFLIIEEFYYKFAKSVKEEILIYNGRTMDKYFPDTFWDTEFSLSNFGIKFNKFFYRIYRIQDRPGFFLFIRNLTSEPIEVRWEIRLDTGKQDTIIQNLPPGLDSWCWNIVDEDLMSWKIYVGQEFVSSGLSSQILNVGLDEPLDKTYQGQINWVEFVK
jgi:FkbM family methyltransferase